MRVKALINDRANKIFAGDIGTVTSNDSEKYDLKVVFFEGDDPVRVYYFYENEVEILFGLPGRRESQQRPF